MTTSVPAKFLEEGAKTAEVYELAGASLKESKTTDGHVLTTTERMAFDVGAYHAELQPSDADKLVQALRAAHFTAAQISQAIDEANLRGDHKELLHAANLRK